MASLFTVSGLDVEFDTPDGDVKAVSDLSFALGRGETLGIVGESGSGKTQALLAPLGLIARNGHVRGSAVFDGTELIGAPPQVLNTLRGSRVSMVFQDPMTSLNPYLTVRRQLTETLVEHQGATDAQARIKAVAMLERVGIADAAKRIDRYPHEFSGGMRQRVMIAMALLCGPDLLIADEPTTALDVTIQAQILELLRELCVERNMAMILITHDLGVVAGLCDRVMVMYAGRVVESASADDIFYQPSHPYTQGLLRSMPRVDRAEDELATIEGQPPNLQHLMQTCAFAPRCTLAFDDCLSGVPALRAVSDTHHSRCLLST